MLSPACGVGTLGQNNVGNWMGNKPVLFLLLLLHLLDQSQCNCEKLRFHNNGICDDEPFGYSSTLGSGCTQPSFLNVHLVDHFHFP